MKRFKTLKIFQIKKIILLKLNMSVYKSTTKPFYKGSRSEYIENARKEKKLLEEG